jgi:iron complex outermembrane receptor protein
MAPLIRWWDGSMQPFDPQPDNLKLFYHNGFTATHNVAFSGGSDNGTIRASFTRTDHDAVTPNSNFHQNTVSIGGTLRVSSRLRTDISLNYFDYFRHNTPSLSNDGSYSFESGMVYSLPRSYKGENFDYQNPDGTRKTFDGWPYLYVNRYQPWNVWNHNTDLTRDKWLGSVGLHYDIASWFSLSGRLGVDNTNDEYETRRKPIDVTGTLIDDGSAVSYNTNIGYEHSLGKQKVLNSEFLATLHKQEILPGIDASLRFGGAQWQRRDYRLTGIGAPRWRDPFLYTFNNFKYDPPATDNDLPRLAETFYQKRINSLYGFLDLGWKNYLFLQLTGRKDWSSTLPPDNNAYFYPSANLSFVATEAFRTALPAWLSHLKARGAASQTGTDDEPFQLSKVYISGVFNGNNTGSLPSSIPPITLKPQRAQSYEAGLELGFWDDRITADFTWYYIHSYDQLLSAPVPNSSGFNYIRINTGAMDNRGIEAIVSARLVQRRDFSWKTGLIYARNRNKLVRLDEGADILEQANVWGSNGPSISVKAGEPYGIIVGFDYVRDEASGKPIVSEDGRFYKITDTKVPIRIFDDNGKFLRIANATPKFTGGWTNTLTWKGLSLYTLVDVKWGGDMWFGSYALNLQSGQSPETLLEREGGGLPFTDPSGQIRNVGVILDGVHADGTPNDKVVHYYYKYLNAGGWGRANTAPAVQENTWIKCREISLSWQLPARWTDRSQVFRGLTVSLTGRDLFFIYDTAPDNINPEGSIGAGNAQGLEFGALPGMRSFGVSVGAQL